MITIPILLCFALAISLGSSQSCSSQDADVIIIGAGMAGIAAAARLQEGGINNILILEGSNRVGGRLKSAQIGGASVSLGPGWIIGRDPADPGLHPLWQIAEKCGGLRGFYQDTESLVNYDSQGDQPEESQFRWQDYENASTGAYNLVAELQQSETCDGVSVRYGLNASGWTPVTPTDNWIEWYSSDYPEGSPPENQGLCVTFGDFDQSYTNFTSPGSSGNEGLNLAYFVSDPDGYEKLVECISNNVTGGENQQTRIIFEAVVTTINWSDDCVCVTATVSGQATEYCSKYAIPTVSVGVLKAGDIAFIPELPMWKRDIINRFDMSVFIHIVMEFGEAFWDTAEQIGYIAESKGSYPIFLNHNITFQENPNVLDVIVTGDVAKRVAGQNKSTTIDEIEAILTIMYPTANVTVLDSAIGDWFSDPLFRGSFIYYAKDLQQTDFERLGEPVGNLYISGSATSVGFAGYVHGALFAGREAAEKVLLREAPTAATPGNKAENLHTSFLIVLLGALCALCY
ncbi:uncharacterized protein LOC135343254 [Halichondria panicea]|uniref:uncharacterized protein LOC135343254 n=1 Tax=Halichondria panicea TaxID=6063 RepID=UPI00312BB800